MKNETPAVSVIIPVYNVEKYLRRCLDSVVNQTFTDFELILVNDGSTDSSLEICQEYAATDSRIKVIDTPNGGCSRARNIGWNNSCGDWILCIDSDDWIELNMIERLYTTALSEEADIVACNIYSDNGAGVLNLLGYPYGPLEPKKEIYRMGINYSAVWNKLVSRNLYEEYDIRWIPGVAMWEDLAVTTRLRFHSKKTVLIPDALYHYFCAQRDNICSREGKKYPKDQICVLNFLMEYFNDKNIPKKLYLKIENTLKQEVKQYVYDSTSPDKYASWKSMYAESNHSILSLCHIPLRTRLSIFIAYHTSYSTFSTIRSIALKLKGIKRLIKKIIIPL